MRKLLIAFLFVALSGASLFAQIAKWDKESGQQGSAAGIVTSDGKTLFASVDNGLFYTMDSGVVWNQVAGVLGQLNSFSIFLGDSLLYGLDEGSDSWELFKSTNEGMQWDSCTFVEAAVNIAANNRGLLAGGGWAGGPLYRSTDEGSTWNPPDSIDFVNRSFNVYKLAMSDSIAVVIIDSGTSMSLIVSTDFGNTWTHGILPRKGVASIAVSNRFIFVSPDSGLFRSSDLGRTWIRVSDFFEATLFATSDRVEIAGSSNDGVIVSSDSGLTWNPFNAGLPTLDVASISLDEHCMYVSLTSGGLYYASLPANSTPVITQDSEGCSLSAWVMQQQPHSTRTLEAPPPVLGDTVITVNGTTQKISIPDGFTMTVFASGIPSCRGLACSPDGVIYATAYNGDVYALPDHHQAGVADSTIVVASGLGDPHGIGFYKGELYVSNQSTLYHIITNGQSRIMQSKVQIASFPGGGSHTSRNFTIDTIKNKFYLQVGSTGNTDTTDIAHRAQIVEMNPDGSAYRTFARGTRNPVGMDIDPRTDALWVNNNGMDNIFGSGTPGTNDNPLESIYLVCDGANYGWPWCYAFRLRNPLMMNLDTSIVETFDGPVAEIEAHSAPLGLHFYRGTKFPAMYHNAIFQCYHGSWDRTPPAPPRVTVMWADTDGHNARVTDFVNGFEVVGTPPDSNTSHYFGRPVSIIEGADSALYVSDDQEGCVYRIAYTAAISSIAPNADGTKFSLADPVPDPARNEIRSMLTLAKLALIQVEVFDEIGNEVQMVSNGEMGVGEHSLNIDASKLSSGSYILRASSGGEVISRRFVIER